MLGPVGMVVQALSETTATRGRTPHLPNIRISAYCPGALLGGTTFIQPFGHCWT